MEKIERKKRGNLSPVWILPLVAIIIGCWLVFKTFHDAGIDIDVYFDDAVGILAGKTQVIFKGIPVGVVKSLEVDHDLKKVIVKIEMVKESKERIVEDMRFWIVRPEVSVNRIAGLDTLIAGSYISVVTGTSTKAARVFQGLNSPPPLPEETPGLRLKLMAPDTASLTSSSPVYYKKFKVGEVISVLLSKEKNFVDIEILIYENYQALINNSSVFWNSSGISFEVGFNKMHMQMDSLASLLSGGISFESQEDGLPLDMKKKLKLHKNKKEAILSRGKRLTFYFEDMQGLNSGAPLRYKEVNIGEIVSIDLGEDLRSFEAVGYVYEQVAMLFKEETYVWMVTPRVKLSGIKNISTAILGPYLAIAPGNGKISSNFKIHSSPPLYQKYSKGITVILQADRPDSLSIGSPVYYRKIQIGEVLHIELAQDSRKVNLYVGIDEKYVLLVRDTSEFWNASGVRVSGGMMTEVKIATESLQAMFSGGIAMAVPEKDIGSPVISGHHFNLLAAPTDGWEKWSPEIQLSKADEPEGEPTLEAATKTKPKNQ